jgi:broad specificity phosphatase PhoE
MTARLSFIAHAATEAQRHAAFPLDELITERELARVAKLGPKIPKAEQIWSAPEQRAQQTSRILGLSAVLADGLRDCDYGKWHGRSIEDVQSEDPDGFLEWLTVPNSAPHGGESIESLIDRVGKWMDQQSDLRHTIAVTHPAVIRAAIVYALRLPFQNFWRFDIAPVTLTDLRLSRDVWTMRCSGCWFSTTGQAAEEESAI